MGKVNTFKKHAVDRYIEREVTNTNVSIKEISNMIKNGHQLYYAKKLTNSKSLAYMKVDNDQIIKFVFNKKTKKIITILPWQDIFKIRIIIHNDHYNNRSYEITLYPDAYLETQCKTTLGTRIIDCIDYTKIEYNHPFFEGLFNQAWAEYLKIKETNSYEKTKSKIKKEFVAIG